MHLVLKQRDLKVEVPKETVKGHLVDEGHY